MEAPAELENQRKQVEKMRRDFVANVSHELRTPLTVIRGYLEALLGYDEPFSDEIQRIFTQMYQQSVRMENLVSGLLLLSRLENDESEPQAQAICSIDCMLRMLVVEAKEICADLKRPHQINLHSERNVCLFGVEEELRSLFSNLIINAVRYTEQAGTIDVRWFVNELGQAVFSVSDTGIGIAEKYIPRLTERFYRVDKGRSQGHSSTGLGLAIVKHVLLRHDATLEIQSELGQGSTFTCVFPSDRIRDKQVV